MVRQHHWLSGHEFEQTPGDSGGRGAHMLQSMGWQRARHGSVTEQQQFIDSMFDSSWLSTQLHQLPCRSLTLNSCYFNWKLSQFSSVQSLSCVRFFAIPWTAACQVSLSITNSWSLLNLGAGSEKCCCQKCPESYHTFHYGQSYLLSLPASSLIIPWALTIWNPLILHFQDSPLIPS